MAIELRVVGNVQKCAICGDANGETVRRRLNGEEQIVHDVCMRRFAETGEMLRQYVEQVENFQEEGVEPVERPLARRICWCRPWVFFPIMFAFGAVGAAGVIFGTVQLIKNHS